MVSLAKKMEGKPFRLIASHYQSWGGSRMLKDLEKAGWTPDLENFSVMSRTSYPIGARYVPYYLIFDENGTMLHHNMGGPFHGGDGLTKYQERVEAAVAKLEGNASTDAPVAEPEAKEKVEPQKKAVQEEALNAK